MEEFLKRQKSISIHSSAEFAVRKSPLREEESESEAWSDSSTEVQLLPPSKTHSHFLDARTSPLEAEEFVHTHSKILKEMEQELEASPQASILRRMKGAAPPLPFV